MSLSTSDLTDIRNIVESALAKQSSEAILPIKNEVKALRNDIEEIHDMFVELQFTKATD